MDKGLNNDGGVVGERGLSGSSQLRSIAISHLDKTLLNHFRPDGEIWKIITVTYDNDNDAAAVAPSAADDDVDELID